VSLVLRIALHVAPDHRRALRDGYRASLSFGRRRRTVEPIVYDAVLVLEAVDALAPGERGIARAYVFDDLPRVVEPVFTLLEGDRIVARAELLETLEDPSPQPLANLREAKTRQTLRRACDFQPHDRRRA
jgi:hypothetical protein